MCSDKVRNATEVYPSMAGILEDPESHCLLFSPIIRIILDWGGGLTSDFVIPGVCNTT